MSEIPEYKFKKDNPNYYEERKKKLNEQTQARYADSQETRERTKARSKQQYNELREALKLVKSQK